MYLAYQRKLTSEIRRHKNIRSQLTVLSNDIENVQSQV